MTLGQDFARGPGTCAKCREMDVERACLLTLCVPGGGAEARRTITVTVDGREAWYAFDVEKVYASDDEARRAAAALGVTDIRL